MYSSTQAKPVEKDMVKEQSPQHRTRHRNSMMQALRIWHFCGQWVFALATPLDFSITPEVPNRENEPFANKCSIQTPCHRQSSPLGHQTERGRRQIKCVLNGGHTTTLSARSTLRKIGWTLAKKQFRAQYCRGSGRHFRTREREQDHRTEFFSGDEKNDCNPNAPTYEDLHTFFKQNTVTGTISWT